MATILLHDISDEMCQSRIWLLYSFGGFSRYVTCQHFITPFPFHDLLKGTSHFMVWLRETHDRHFSTHVDTSDVWSNKTNTSKQFNSVFSFGFDLERIIWIPNFWTEYLLNFLISKQWVLICINAKWIFKTVIENEHWKLILMDVVLEIVWSWNFAFHENYTFTNFYKIIFYNFFMTNFSFFGKYLYNFRFNLGSKFEWNFWINVLLRESRWWNKIALKTSKKREFLWKEFFWISTIFIRSNLNISV